MYRQETDVEQYARNVNQYKWLILLMFAVSAIGFTVVGYNTPKQYLSYATLLVEKEKLLAQQVGADVSKNEKTLMEKSKSIVFSRKVMSILGAELGVGEGIEDPVQKGNALKLLRNRVYFELEGDNYIKLGFTDLDPKKAKSTAEFLANLFVEEAIGGKAKDSSNAYDFINAQVAEYHQKLKTAEDNLKDFTNERITQGVTSQEAVYKRLQLLQTLLEDAQLQLKEASIRRSNLQSQLQGEVQIQISASKQSEFISKIQNYKSRLADLRLNYHDDYPDIVFIREQIADAEKQMREEKRRSLANLSSGNVDDSVRVNPVYQDMKLRLSTANTQMATLNIRVNELKKNIEQEKQKSKIVSHGDNELSELTRDYDVNESFYKDLLERRERAGIARDIEVDKIYSGVKLFEPAFLPVDPAGIRFAHFVLAGLGLGAILPFGFIFLLQFFNQSIKSKDMLKDMGIPVLIQMNKVKTVADSRIERLDGLSRLLLLGTTFALIGAMVFLRLTTGGGG